MTGFDGPPAVGQLIDDRLDRRVLGTVLACVLVFSSSMTIVSASLPTIADDLGSTEAVVSWAVTGLFLVMSVTTPVMGRLGDGHGHRRMFLLGTVILGVGTLACAIAPTAHTFVAARMVVGLGISAAMPNGLALIIDAHSHQRRAEALGWFQMVMTGAPVVALIIGGPLIEAFGWRAVFAVLFPMSIIGFTLAVRTFPPDDATRETVTIDYPGAAALGTATLGFLLWLQFGGSRGFSNALVITMAVVCVGGLIGFVNIERRAAVPLLRLDYFSRRNFTGPLLNHPLGQFAYMGGFLMAPLMLDALFGYSVGVIALVLLFRPAAFSLSSPLGGRWSARIGERLMLLAGAGLMVASMAAWFVAALQVSLTLVIIGLILSGLGMGVSSPSYQTAITSAVDARDLGIASGMGTTLVNIGILSGIQTSFVVLGDGREPADFARTFLIGGVVAGIGGLGALMMDRR